MTNERTTMPAQTFEKGDHLEGRLDMLLRKRNPFGPNALHARDLVDFFRAEGWVSPTDSDRRAEDYFTSGWSAALHDVISAQAHNRLDEFLVSQRKHFGPGTAASDA